MSQHSRINILVLTFASLISQFIGYFYRIVLSRVVSPEVLGLYQLITPMYSLAHSTILVCVTIGVSTLSAAYFAAHDTESCANLVKTAFTIFFSLFFVVSVLSVAFKDFIVVNILGDYRTRIGFLLLIPCLGFTAIENIIKHHFYGCGEVIIPSIVEIIEQLSRFASVITLLTVFQDVSDEARVGIIVLGMVICEIISSFILIVFYRIKRRKHGNFSKTEAKKLLKLGFPIVGINLSGSLMSSLNSVMIPSRLTETGLTYSESLSQFGLVFGVVSNLVTLPTFFVSSIGLLLGPKIARASSLNDCKSLKRLIEKGLAVTAFLMLPCCSLFLILAPTVSQFLYGSEDIVKYMIPMCIISAIGGFCSIVSSMLNGLKLQSRAAGNYIASGIIQLVLTYILIPQLGIYGYFIASAVSSVFVLLSNLFCVLRHTGAWFRLFDTIIVPLLSAILCGAVSNVLFTSISSQGVNTILCVILTCLAAIITYLLTLKFQGYKIKSGS